MNLVIDIGNTRSKYAFFDDTRLVEVRYQTDSLLGDIVQWKEKGVTIDTFLTGSGIIDDTMRLQLINFSDSYLEASPEMTLPLVVGYDTPETLGFDRIAICVGAISLCPHLPLLVIDSGTALTFNYLTFDRVLLGGNISPGLEMRFRALHQFTARLPHVAPAESYGGIGRTTEEAIRNGVMEGIRFEIESYISNFINQNKTGRVIITGGNSPYLAEYLKNKVLFSDNLGFIGLNQILIHVKKHN